MSPVLRVTALKEHAQNGRVIKRAARRARELLNVWRRIRDLCAFRLLPGGLLVRHRIHNIIDAEAHAKSGELFGIARIVGPFPGIAYI